MANRQKLPGWAIALIVLAVLFAVATLYGVGSKTAVRNYYAKY